MRAVNYRSKTILIRLRHTARYRPKFYLIGWLVGWLVGWLAGWLVD